MKMNFNIYKTLALIIILATGITLAASSNADIFGNPFDVGGYTQLAAAKCGGDEATKCGAAKCGGDEATKCGSDKAAKCGGDKAAKCGGNKAAKCGGDMAAKCGGNKAAKCGGDMAASGSKCGAEEKSISVMEGKCGAGKCGSTRVRHMMDNNGDGRIDRAEYTGWVTQQTDIEPEQANAEFDRMADGAESVSMDDAFQNFLRWEE